MAHFRQELDEPRNALLSLVLTLTLFAFLLGTIWGYVILMRRLHALAPSGPKAIPAEANGVEVGGVNHWMFDAAGDQPALDQRKRAELSRYGWVDRAGGRVRIPVERAMELIIKEASP